MGVELATKALVIWAGILVLAIGNGILREAVLIHELGTAAAHVLSGVLLSCLILATAYLSLPWLGIRDSRPLLVVGLGWLVLTLVFEFSFGLVLGTPVSEILEAYTFRDGNIWPVVLAATAAASWAAAKLRGWL